MFITITHKQDTENELAEKNAQILIFFSKKQIFNGKS